MWAALKGHVEMCQLLLENGAELEAKDSLGATALILTVQHGQHLTFLSLLDRGANPEVGDIRGATCVHWAAYKGALSLPPSSRCWLARVIAMHGGVCPHVYLSSPAQATTQSPASSTATGTTCTSLMARA